MKKTTMSLAIAVLVTVIGVGALGAQERGRRGEGGPPPDGPPGPGPSPLVAALDENGDGEISPDEIEKASESLKGLDANSDGKLSGEEIRPRPGRGPAGQGNPPDAEARGRGPEGVGGGERGGRDPAQFLERLMQADANGDGKISKEEAPERLQANFDRMDQNSDGFLDKEDISGMAARMGGRRGPEGPGGPGGAGPGPGSPEGFVERLFQFDADGDGKLSREELAQMGPPGGPGGPGGRGGPPDGDGPRPRRPQRPDGDN